MATKKIVPIIEEVYLHTSPASVFQCLEKFRHSFFLDSAADNKKLGRYSFFGYAPFLIFTAKGNSVTLTWADGRVERYTSNPFFVLKDILNRYRVLQSEGDIPFASGGVGYFAYDLKNFVEVLPDSARDDIGIPDCNIGFYDALVIHDHLKGKTFLSHVGLPGLDKHSSGKRLKALRDIIANARGYEAPRSLHNKMPRLTSNFSKSSYIKMVEKAKEYIKKGDIYQVNLSQRFEAELTMEPWELYRRLRDVSPAPFASYLRFGDIVIASSSPERFLMKREDYIETRPIKGTRPRSDDPAYDARLAKELLESRKDRAEHIMIVDLERNDLGRICVYGSVKPTERIVLEKYSTVFHLVSTIAGKLKKGIDPIDCLLATFPGGSITGAPKIRAMEIIEELEPVKRSVYTGAIGYLSFDGRMDTSIAIRTCIINNNKLYFQVGGGIVADSDPEKEYFETLDKAQGFLRAIGIRSGKEALAV